MKILKLKFKNINSLSGENEIDFTQAVFTNDGLFAITGKTGAGKTSILDAISLALYGRTPRVEISGNENAVITKGEKDCYAEIVFEVGGKIWKSSWKQEVNRNGNLKPVNRVIADSNDTIIADQVRACNEKIVEIIGLKFEQFTKVVMLAQGSFAAFLQAGKDEKGALLEQITGTEIYGEISKRVFERSKIEKDKLNKILIEIQAIKTFTEEEIENLTNENTLLENEKKQVDEEARKIEVAQKWLRDIATLQTQILEAKQQLPALEDKVNATRYALENAETKLQAAKDELKKQEPVFKKVREIDTKISEKEKLLQPIIHKTSELLEYNNRIAQSLKNQQSDYEITQQLLTQNQHWLNEHKHYESLVAAYSAIEKESELLQTSSNEITQLQKEISILQSNLEQKKTTVENATRNYTVKSKSLQAKEEELHSVRIELSSLLNGNELPELLFRKERVSAFGVQLKSLIELEESIAFGKIEIEKNTEEIKQFEKSAKELSVKIEVDKNTKALLEKQIDILNENIKLSQTILSLEEHRKQLKDGVECPLCGSKEHPFAHENIPQAGEKEQDLTDLKNWLYELNSSIQQNLEMLATLNSKRDSAFSNKQKEEIKLAENVEKRKIVLAEIKALDSDISILTEEPQIEQLKKILTQKREELIELNVQIQQATNIEQKISVLRDKEIPALQIEKHTAEQSIHAAEMEQKLAAQQLEVKQNILGDKQAKFLSENENYFNRLKTYSVENIEALKLCLEAWNVHKKQADDLANKITALKNDIAINQKELENQTKLLAGKQEEMQSIEKEKQELAEERTKLFSSQSVEEEENRLNKTVENAEATKITAQQASAESNMVFAQTMAIITEKEKEFSHLNQQKITEKPQEELQAELDEIKIKADELSQKIGANKQALKTNEDNLKASGSKLKEKEKQQIESNKWGKLNELVGSVDGKKYRNFAQALTFEYLIGLSNKQLQKMSERYILKRVGDASNPFELSVLDKFQNSEERTAQNLSGGEKFIVSLSLALGLANMASKNMRIDTMFIDEGFGTLDTDYLDIALNALANLQSEGKVIGVISHLTELKERIATHIEVIPSGNGHSKIQITY
ncbi:MAG: AAA family ATPase [Bacteroidetes bacterium]|nr:AAA family ATPase [Bacteroidota bacterium]MBS1739059.1 AAA family ATPase [Bacteroidota bacterium]